MEKHGQVNFAYEADALRVLFVGRGQLRLRRYPPDIGLEHVSDGEQGLAQLLLRQLAEEIALVLGRVAPLKYPPDRLAVCPQRLLFAAVMSGSHHVSPEPPGCLEEGVKLDLAVAQHVRVGSAPFGVLVEHVVHHPLAVFLAQVHKIERDPYLAGNQLRHIAVFLPFAVAMQCAFHVVPVLHEHGKHIIALPLEQQGRHAGVNASGKSYAYLHG